MKQAGVGQVDPRRADLTLGDVGVPRLELPDDEGLPEQLQVPANGVVGDPEGACELGAVPQLPVVVGEHGPGVARARGWEPVP